MDCGKAGACSGAKHGCPDSVSMPNLIAQAARIHRAFARLDFLKIRYQELRKDREVHVGTCHASQLHNAEKLYKTVSRLRATGSRHEHPDYLVA